MLLPRANTRDRLQYKHCRPVRRAHLESCNDEIICLYSREGREEAGDRAWSSQLEMHWDSHPVICAGIGRQSDTEVQTALMQWVVNSPVTFSCAPATMGHVPPLLQTGCRFFQTLPDEVFQLIAADFRPIKQGGFLPLRKFPWFFRKHLSFYYFNYENKPKRILPNFYINEE